jgi:hypothetical protein
MVMVMVRAMMLIGCGLPPALLLIRFGLPPYLRKSCAFPIAIECSGGLPPFLSTSGKPPGNSGAIGKAQLFRKQGPKPRGKNHPADGGAPR